MARSDAEVVSNLPVFAVKRSKDWPAWLIVTCPRCECSWLVKIVDYYKRHTYGRKNTVITGRPCPYCFKTGALPARRSIR